MTLEYVAQEFVRSGNHEHSVFCYIAYLEAIKVVTVLNDGEIHGVALDGTVVNIGDIHNRKGLANYLKGHPLPAHW